ncbi:MAG: ABC transporter permease [Desulfosudaceae bacterium]
MNIYRIPLGETIEAGIDFFVEHFSFATKAFSEVAENGMDIIQNVMMFFPPWVLILIFTGLAWFLSKRWGVALFTFLGLLLIWNMNLWAPTVSTIALIIIAVLFAVIIGIPLGILSALSEIAYRVITPILDVMQTMPAFVYLIPAIPFFGLGKVGAVFSTVIFSVPPCIRLTSLGIKQVPKELIEAADAFGSSKAQKLFKVQLPIAKTTIMAGINQTVMLALSMVVIASMIGAKGLGGEVWKAIQRLQAGRGFEAGIGIVIVAIILDRVMQRLAGGKQQATS